MSATANGRPTQFHAVPVEERAIDSQGKTLPWALEWHEYVKLILTIFKTAEFADVFLENTPISVIRSGTLTRKEHLANLSGAEGQREARGPLHLRRRKIL